MIPNPFIQPLLPPAWQLALYPVLILHVNGLEWFFHKYVLHGLGKSKKSFWNFHWGVHHGNARRGKFIDDEYRASVLKWNARTKEGAALLLGGVAHLPVLWLGPIAYMALVYGGLRYYFTHKYAHMHPEWARKHLPWHYDHHMGANQDANWCVTQPWFDWVMGTRIRYTYPAVVPRAQDPEPLRNSDLSLN